MRYFAADLSVSHLLRMLQDGSLVVPSFQRGYVWTKDMASRYILWLMDSLPLGQMVFAEGEDSILQVIDGSQRLRSLLYFQQGTFHDGSTFVLTDVGEPYEGKAFVDLTDAQKLKFHSAVQHAMVLQPESKEDWDSARQVYEVLNETGVKLHRHDLRCALYPGRFVDLIRSVTEYKPWQGLTPDIASEQEELVLRFFALLYDGKQYKRPMKGFLDSFLQTNQDLQRIPGDELISIFEATASAISGYLGINAFRPKRRFSQTVFNVVMVGVAMRLRTGPINEGSQVREQYTRLLHSEDLANLSRIRVWDEKAVSEQLHLAEIFFGDVQ